MVFPWLRQFLAPPLVLPDESLQEEEFSIHQISKNLSKILDASVFSLPNKHNSGHQLPEELPGDILCTPLVWLLCSSVIPPLQRSYNGPYAVLCHSPCPFTIRVGARDEVVSISWLKPCTDAGSPRCRDRPPGVVAKPATACCSGPATPRQVSFSDPLVSTASRQEQPRKHMGAVFS
jgi:hypothetical protein